MGYPRIWTYWQRADNRLTMVDPIGLGNAAAIWGRAGCNSAKVVWNSGAKGGSCFSPIVSLSFESNFW